MMLHSMIGSSILILPINTLNKLMIHLLLFKEKMYLLLFGFGLFLASKIGFATEQIISSIAFGSCLKETRPQPIWNSVNKYQPDVFILLGDNIYGDTAEVDKLREKWNRFELVEGFQKLRANSLLLAIWDDHDYGKNDAGGEFQAKAGSQEVFLDFLNEPKDSIRRKTPGIYDCVTIGPIGKRVQFILLDTRYFRTPLKRAKIRKAGNGPYEPNFSINAGILGVDQWRWLEEQLQVPADIRIIASSIQVLSSNHGWETWGNFPEERKRLIRLLGKAEGESIIISGDRHSAEISELNERQLSPLLDITSSAMNQKQHPNEEQNIYRIGNKYFRENFGTIEIDWERKKPVVFVNIKGLDGDNKIQHKIDYNTP